MIPLSFLLRPEKERSSIYTNILFAAEIYYRLSCYISYFLPIKKLSFLSTHVYYLLHVCFSCPFFYFRTAYYILDIWLFYFYSFCAAKYLYIQIIFLYLLKNFFFLLIITFDNIYFFYPIFFRGKKYFFL